MSCIAGGKGSYYEGGLRVPMVAWWPTVIAPNSHSSDIISLMDIFPTLLDLAGADVPNNVHIDGVSFANILLNQTNAPRESLFFYDCTAKDTDLVALRYKQYKIYWKLHAVSNRVWFYCNEGIPMRDYYTALIKPAVQLNQPEMFDIVADPQESTKLNIADHANILQEVDILLDGEMQTLSDKKSPLLDRRYISNHLMPCCNPPFCTCNFPNLKSKKYEACNI